MAMKFQDVFAGERVGSGKVQGQAGVDDLSGTITKRPEAGAARRRQGAEKGLGHNPAMRTGDPHDADSADTRGRGDGGYAIAKRHGGAGLVPG